MTPTDLNKNFEDVEDSFNGVDKNNDLWEHTKILVGTSTVSGDSVASLALTGISIDLDDFDIEVIINIDRDNTQTSLSLSTDGGGYKSQTLTVTGATVAGAAVSSLPLADSVGTDPLDVTSIGIITLAESSLPAYFFSTTVSTIDTGGVSHLKITNGKRTVAITNNIVTDVTVTAGSGTPIEDGSFIKVYRINRA